VPFPDKHSIMAYLELFDAVAKHVRARGCQVPMERGELVDKARLDRAARPSAIPLPESSSDPTTRSSIAGKVMLANRPPSSLDCHAKQSPFPTSR
jgi:hypothetical protein